MTGSETRELRSLSVSLVSILLALVLRAAGPAVAADGPELRYPETPRGDVVDIYHGVEVADPYRWLEEDVRTSDRVRDWVEAQNEVTFGYLEFLSERAEIRDRLEALWDYPRARLPEREGGLYFHRANDGLQNQDVLYVSRSLDSLSPDGLSHDADSRVLIDPNEWSEDGTVALGGTSPSPDGRYLAYARAEAGSDWRTWRVMEVESGRRLPDEIRWTKWGGVSWTEDGRGFFYSRFPPPKEGEEYQSLNVGQEMYYHRLGTAQEEDVLVYAIPEHPEWSFFGGVTEDGRYLVILVSRGDGSPENKVLYRDLEEPYAMPTALIGEFESEYRPVGTDGSVFYFLTDRDAPRKKVIAIDVGGPAEGEGRRRVVIPQSESTLSSVSLVGNVLVASYLEDARSRVRVFRKDGSLLRDVDLPGIGSAYGFRGKAHHTETFYHFSSFATPPSIYRYDLLTGESELHWRAEVDFDPADYEVSQVFYTSKDGTRVPMFLAHRKGLELDGSNPTLLYGYGGFAISQTPRFSVSRLAWMEMGGVFALANLRGGGEYGEEWHQAGTKTRKQNVFDDFLAAAEWLIENDYTRPGKLAIQGGSNGGLLVGAAMTQRPDLFGAALPAVGVMDMLRFHKFTAGRFWVEDYGSSENEEQFRALYAYSPYHNLEKDAYPATLVTTADTDDRVVPGHSFKFAARLQQVHLGDDPVLIRIESRAGHGAGTPTSKRIERVADQWAFLVENLEMELD